MRKVNWDEKLSDDDIAWLRTTGIPGIEDRIEKHQAEYDADVPEPEVPADEVTRSALDPSASASTPAMTGDGPVLVDPRQEDPQDDDDYESWTVSELKSEVDGRNKLENTSAVTLEGTGANGSVTKADLIKGLRLWDAENPDALAG